MIRTARRWGGLAVLGLLLGCSGHDVGARGGRGTATCTEAVRAWAERCSAREHLTIPTLQCPEPGLILADLGEAAALRVEVRRATPQSFRQVGAWGLSPVGNFPDWNRVDCYRARELRLRDPLSRRLVDGAGVPTATMDLIGLPVRSPLAAM